MIYILMSKLARCCICMHSQWRFRNILLNPDLVCILFLISPDPPDVTIRELPQQVHDTKILECKATGGNPSDVKKFIYQWLFTPKEHFRHISCTGEIDSSCDYKLLHKPAAGRYITYTRLYIFAVVLNKKYHQCFICNVLTSLALQN